MISLLIFPLLAMAADSPSMSELGDKCQPSVRYGMGDQVTFQKLEASSADADAFQGQNVLIVPGHYGFALDRTVIKEGKVLPRLRLSRNADASKGGETYFGDVEKHLREKGIEAKWMSLPQLGLAGPDSMGKAVKEQILRSKKPLTLVCHSYGFYGCIEALLALSPEDRKGISVRMYQPAAGGSPIAVGDVLKVPVKWMPTGGIQAMNPEHAKDFMNEHLAQICALAKEMPMSVTVSSSPQEALNKQPVMRAFQVSTGYGKGLRDTSGPGQCPWNDGFVFADQSSIPCKEIAHYYRPGSHVQYFEPGSAPVDDLISAWGAAKPFDHAAPAPASAAEPGGSIPSEVPAR